MTAGFAARLRAGSKLLGPLLRMPNETLIELTGDAGMDFVVVDTEHGPADQIPLSAHIAAATAVGLPTLVRVGSPTEILRVLDLGAAGIIVPHVSSVDQARAIVRAAHYPPVGDRGFATYTRAGRHGLATAADHLAAAAQTLVIAMIEDGPGVRAAADIAAVDGIDALFVGPADLALALGHPGRPGDPEVVAAIASVHDAARAAGRTVVAITATADGARSQFDSGATVVIYNVLAALDTLMLELAAAGSTTDQPPPPVAPTDDPVVLLPGMSATPAVWDEVARLLAPRAVCGLRIDVDDSVAEAAASVLAQAPPRFALAGHSLGGIVAVEVARQAPDRVSRLALVNTSARAASEEQLRGWQRLIDRLDAGEFDAVAGAEADRNAGGNTALVPALITMARQVGPDGLRRQLRAQAGRVDQLPALAGLSMPALVVGGADDRVCPPDRAREIAAALPAGRLETLDDCGHIGPLEAPDRLAALLSRFL